MRKPLIWALFLIALCVLFFIFTDGNTAIEFFSFKQKVPASLALLSFTGVGLVIEALLK